MAKKSVIAGEYIIEIADNGHVDVLRIHRNAKATMEEIAERKAFPVKKSWNTRALGANLVKEFGDGKTAQFDGITLTRLDDGGIEVQEHFKSTIEVLRQIADKVGCRYEEGWNTQRLGSKLTDYLEEHKDKVDKLLTTPNKKRQGEAREGSPSVSKSILKKFKNFLEKPMPLLVMEFSDLIAEDNDKELESLIQDNCFGLMWLESTVVGVEGVEYEIYVGAMQDNFAQAKAFVAKVRANAPEVYEGETFFYRYATKVESYGWVDRDKGELHSALRWIVAKCFHVKGVEIGDWPLTSGVKMLLKKSSSSDEYEVLTVSISVVYHWWGFSVWSASGGSCTIAEGEQIIKAVNLSQDSK